MPVPAMAESVLDHQKRFQAAVDVIHNLPKNGSYRPSYEVMLRFYGLYKQAVCGPCAGARPGFWDPVGRYKWDAWSSLGDMSTESAMAAYVDEMKKVAQEVIDTMPMNEKTASLFHHFEPLYVVIDDMPRPPESLLTLREGLRGSEAEDGSEQVREEEEQTGPQEATDEVLGLDLTEVIDLSANTVPYDPGLSEGLVLTSDSESEIFCDSVDSVEQLTDVKVEQLTEVKMEQLTDVRVEQLTAVKAPVIKSNGFHNGHVSSPVHEPEGRVEVRQVGAGQGGEGANDGKGPDQGRGSRDAGREASYHSWRERGVPQGSPRRGAPGGGGAGRGGGDGSEAAERLHDVQLQQQIILALRRLREDMRSVMERLEAVERLAATHTQGSEWRPCLHCAAAASQQQEEKWWPFDVSGQTVLLFLLWPFLAQGLVHLLRRVQRRSRISS